MQVLGNFGNAEKVTASLPRVMSCCDNVQLLRTDADAKAALDQMMRLVAEVAEVPSGPMHYTRVDPCIYIPIAPSILLPLYEKRKHPGFHRVPVCYAYGLAWGSARGKKRLQFYDKKAEQKAGNDFRTRVELQLHSTYLREYFGVPRGQQLTHLSLTTCYTVLRQFLLKFAHTKAAPAYNQDTLVAWCMAHGVRAPDGQHIMDWRTQGLSRAVAAKVRNKISRVSLELSNVEWVNFLPEHPTEQQLIQMT